MPHNKGNQALTVRKFLKPPYPEQNWLPNTPDFNPIDYVWGTVNRETCKTPRNTKNEMKARITAAFTNLNEKTTGNACRRSQSHLEDVVVASGDFFE